MPKTTQWRPLRVGAGGYVTGIDIAPDGTKVCRADSSGAYIWDTAINEWRPLVTMKSMPKGSVGHLLNNNTGVYEVVIAPSDTRVIYLAFEGTVYRSADRGVTFAKTALTGIAASGNDDYRTMGRRIAVDPVNPNVLYVGTQDQGLFLTTDGGASFAKVSAIPAGTNKAGILVAFDPSAGTSGGRSRGLYVSSQGNGVYKSSDAGTSFTRLNNGPRDHNRMTVSPTGDVWMTSTTDQAWKLAAGSTTFQVMTPSAGLGAGCIAINPADPRHIVMGAPSGTIAQSFDGGTTWTGGYWLNTPEKWAVRVANDIPWLAWTLEDWMSAGEIFFDPSASNKLYFAEGIGVWHTTPPRPPQQNASFSWISQSKGIEQLVSNKFITPPGGTPLYFVQDRSVFRIENPDVFPSRHGPNNKHSIVQGYSGDYAADDPNFIVGMFNWFGREESGYSTDGGVTWTKFASVPADLAAGKISGSIAVNTKDNMVWVPSNNGNPYYTKDRGRTWTRVNIPGVPTTGQTGWGWAYYLFRHIVTADKTTPGTFYMYNYLDPVAGVYKTTDGGDTWTRVFSGVVEPWSTFHTLMDCVPGQKGHLFFSCGHEDGPNPGNLKWKRSTDGGVTWTAVPDFQEVYCFGFGKAAPGQSYPAIYVAGFYKLEWGVWRSDDNTASWSKIGDYPLDCIDQIKTISGDMNVYGRVYAGFGGSGAAIGDLV